MNRRWLWGSFVATLAASVGVALQPADEAPAVAAALDRPARAAAPARQEIPAPVDTTPRAAIGEPPAAALAAWSAPPAPPPAAPASAARPAPPAFPYRWIGRLDDTVLLAGPQRSFGAVQGEVLDQRWRIERIAGSRLHLVWLPTGEPQTLELR